MFKKFTDGLIFGSGFTIAFIVLWYIAAYAIQPMIATSQIDRLNHEYSSNKNEKLQPSTKLESGKPSIPFHAQGIDEQIKLSSAIALTKYELGTDGRMKAIVKAFLKKDPNTTIYYKVGDEYPPASYFPKDNTSHGDGSVIFFTGSPATMQMSMTYSGDRILGLGDMPLDLFRDKCK